MLLWRARGLLLGSMFTGIVQGMATVVRAERGEGVMRLAVDVEHVDRWEVGKELPRGSSVAVAGVCLTVVPTNRDPQTETHQRTTIVAFDLMGETLAKTTLGSLCVGDVVNVERSARFGDEIGGHLVSGHVTGTVVITNVSASQQNRIITFGCDVAWMPYIFPKGFIALDGCSLTIVDVGADWFTVHLIPETCGRTTFGMKSVGDRVHLEIDATTRAVVDTVRALR